jgi:hypothetical protein
MRTTFLLCALLSVSCDSLHQELPSLFDARPLAKAARTAVPQQTQQLRQSARRLESRFTPPAMPTSSSVAACERTATPPRAEGEARGLALANVDVRTRTKNLIPRRVTERLESGEVALLATLRDDQPSNIGGALPPDVPASASSLTAEDLEQMARQRYLGVFYVTDYQGPALILRVGEIHREWFAGSLGATFVLFDTEQQLPICAAALRVRNDVKSAPIRVRLQAETRNRLERDLGDALRVEAERVTEGLAGLLEWPESSRIRAELGSNAAK